jgi:hypothetical protein
LQVFFILTPHRTAARCVSILQSPTLPKQTSKQAFKLQITS